MFRVSHIKTLEDQFTNSNQDTLFAAQMKSLVIPVAGHKRPRLLKIARSYLSAYSFDLQTFTMSNLLPFSTHDGFPKYWKKVARRTKAAKSPTINQGQELHASFTKEHKEKIDTRLRCKESNSTFYHSLILQGCRAAELLCRQKRNNISTDPNHRCYDADLSVYPSHLHSSVSQLPLVQTKKP